MEGRNNSLICSGSHLNQRTFKEAESWSELESTVLAGNLESKSEVWEDDSKQADSNILNCNIDAISADDDDVFYDCQLSPSVGRNQAPSPSPPAKSSNSTNLPIIHPTSISRPTFDSGVSGEMEENTGLLLVQALAAGDFDSQVMVVHAQSTPNALSSDEGNFSSKSGDETGDSKAGARENVSPLTAHQASRRALRSPSVLNASGKVAKLINVLEQMASSSQSQMPSGLNKEKNGALSARTSRKPLPVLSKQSKSTRAAYTGGGSSSHFKQASKLEKSRAPSNNGEQSSSSYFFMQHRRRGGSRLNNRSSSCSGSSGAPCSMSEDSLEQVRRRSRSVNDTTSPMSSGVSRSMMQRNYVHVRRYSPAKSGNVVAKLITTPGKPSAITSRRSVGRLVKTPIKSVRDLRKAFSPKVANNNGPRKWLPKGNSTKLPKIVVDKA